MRSLTFRETLNRSFTCCTPSSLQVSLCQSLRECLIPGGPPNIFYENIQKHSQSKQQNTTKNWSYGFLDSTFSGFLGGGELVLA